MFEPGVPDARRPAALGRMCEALMLVTSELGVEGVGMGGLDTRAAGGVGGMSRAAARQDMARPSAASEEAETGVGVAAEVGAEDGSGGGRGGRGLLLGLAGEGTTGGGAGAVLGGSRGCSASAQVAGGAASPLELTLELALGVSLVSLIGSSDSVLTDPLDLVESCLRRVPDSLGSVNCVVLLT